MISFVRSRLILFIVIGFSCSSHGWWLLPLFFLLFKDSFSGRTWGITFCSSIGEFHHLSIHFFESFNPNNYIIPEFISSIFWSYRLVSYEILMSLGLESDLFILTCFIVLGASSLVSSNTNFFYAGMIHYFSISRNSSSSLSFETLFALTTSSIKISDDFFGMLTGLWSTARAS